MSEDRMGADVREPVWDGEQSSPSLGSDEQGSSEPTDVRHEELLARLQDAEAAREELLGDLRRVAADFDNYRKRTAREHERVIERAGARIVAKLLPVLDDLERALDAVEHHEEAKVIEGVRMTRDHLSTLLASEGVEEIEAAGAFDPHVHEALVAQPGGEGVESGTVLQVVQRGYRLGETVVRPARVVVAE